MVTKQLELCILCKSWQDAELIQQNGWKYWYIPWKKMMVVLCPHCSSGLSRMGSFILPAFWLPPTMELEENGHYKKEKNTAKVSDQGEDNQDNHEVS